MTQATAEFKAPHWRIYQESIKQLYKAGILTARGAVYAAIQAARKPGHKLRVKNVKEFGEELGLKKATTYKAISELRSLNYIEWSEVGGIDLWIPESGNVVQLHRNESTNIDSESTNVDCIPESWTPSLQTWNHTPLKPAQDMASSDSPNYSYSSSSINSQCSFITHTGEAEVLDSEPEGQGSNLAAVATVDVPVNSGSAVNQVAEGQGSATPPSTILDFENSPGAKCNAMFTRGSDAHEWEDYPGYPKAEFAQWYGDRFYAKAPNAFQSKTDWTRSMLRKPDRAAAAWADYQAELQQSEQVREQIATPAESSIEQFQKPVADVDQAEVYRIKAKIGIAQSLGRALDAATAARAKELGIEVGQVVDVAPEPTPVVPPAPEPEPFPQQSGKADFSQLRSLLGMKPSAEPTSFEDLTDLIWVQRQRLRWSEAQLDEFVELNFCKRSTQYLNDDQLAELLELLKEEQP